MEANLILTDSYFNVFPLLTDELRGKANDLTHKNLVFCEEKLSLMAERFIAAQFGGTFNTEVFSFGNFLRAKKPINDLLSKEGSNMAIKKILSEIPLKCFNKAKTNLAPSLFELISQLKSAKVSDRNLLRAAESTDGILSAKLHDIAAVFAEYEKFLAANGLFDQSSALSFLPEIVENDESVNGAEVFIIGFTAFTVQIRKVIAAFFPRASKVTAILTSGDNRFAFVNETAEIFRTLCRENGVVLHERKVTSDYSDGGKTIKDGLFNPLYSVADKPAEKPQAFYFAAKSVDAEAERVAEIIRRKVMDGENRFRDFAVIVPTDDAYSEAISKSFARLEVPYFLDDKKKPSKFPLPTLVTSYCDLFLRGLKIPVLAAFFKNPYIPFEREFKDRFENYLYKYDISYGKFKKPFVARDGEGEEIAQFEEFRAFIAGLIDKFDVQKMFDALNIEERTQALSDYLISVGENEDAGINVQVADKVKGIISEMNFLLPTAKSDPYDFKSVFSSGVAAMELSVIPQYNDAVFVGSFRQAAIARSKFLFAVGLTDSVPSFYEDVALLTDGDIDALADIKVLLEPKIGIVNHRLREEVALGLSAYSDGLYLSYPLSDYSGNAMIKSELFSFFAKHFTLQEFPKFNGYMTKKQGMRTFARDCGRFVTCKTDDFSYPIDFYKATNGEPAKIADYADREIKERLDGGRTVLTDGEFSPTEIESYYACPYRTFLTHALNVKERETGKITALSFGIFVHDVLRNFVSVVDKVTDENFDEMFDAAVKPVLNSEKYARFDGEENEFSVKVALKESKTYCRKLVAWYKKSEFKPTKTEVKFGDGEEKRNGYPAVELFGGKVKLTGKIDRVDTYKDYFRVIDYKTGNVNLKDGELFAGIKLQLYLYSLAVTDKILAGAYYLHINDEYTAQENKDKPVLEGKTSDAIADAVAEGEEEFILVRTPKKSYKFDVVSVQKYVKALAEQAAEQMADGVIVASPYAGTCDHCEFASICGQELTPRKMPDADTDYIVSSADCPVNARGNRKNDEKDGAK
ncbi:MAG: PD-(D/E)XK nuclease family protein [Clostridia bacterium]|nr:PD-(D/E)XK nuclease family protein [Clostridia bacterium]